MASPADAGASGENRNNNDSYIMDIRNESEPELTNDFPREIPVEVEPKLSNDFPREIPVEVEPKLTIYRVPRKLRKLNEDAYTPNQISIGPFHHGKMELKDMEPHKERYQEQFVERRRTTKSLDDLKTFIKGQYYDVRCSYAGIPKLNEKEDSEFQHMILLDACFIIELFLKNHEGKKEDYILSTAWLKKAIQLDLILLENQLPYFLLEKLFQTAKPKYRRREYKVHSNRKECNISCPCFKSSNPESLRDEKRKGTPDSENEFLLLACDFFEDFCTRSKKLDDEILNEMKRSGEKMKGSDESDEKKKEIKHFTDLVRKFRLLAPTDSQENQRFRSGVDHLYSATELDKAGVNFVVNDEARLVDVKFPSEYCYYPLRMELPALMLDDATELLFRNMIALEQCLYSREAYICNFVSLMSQLINTDQDAGFLVEKKIIKNLSSHGIVDLFTRLGKETSVSYFSYAQDCKKMNEYHDKWLNRTMTKAKKVYFNDLWKTSSTVVGFFLLLFSISGSVKNIFLS